MINDYNLILEPISDKEITIYIESNGNTYFKSIPIEIEHTLYSIIMAKCKSLSFISEDGARTLSFELDTMKLDRNFGFSLLDDSILLWDSNKNLDFLLDILLNDFISDNVIYKIKYPMDKKRFIDIFKIDKDKSVGEVLHIGEKNNYPLTITSKTKVDSKIFNLTVKKPLEV